MDRFIILVQGAAFETPRVSQWDIRQWLLRTFLWFLQGRRTFLLSTSLPFPSTSPCRFISGLGCSGVLWWRSTLCFSLKGSRLLPSSVLILLPYLGVHHLVSLVHTVLSVHWICDKPWVFFLAMSITLSMSVFNLPWLCRCESSGVQCGRFLTKSILLWSDFTLFIMFPLIIRDSYQCHCPILRFQLTGNNSGIPSL